MSQKVVFGIVGGYGATGRVVVSELWKSRVGEVLIGGRDLARGRDLAAEFDARVSAAHLDVLDGRSLDDFCSRCSIVVNCAGPVMELQDRVAQAAVRRRCHYVDVAGLSFVKERMPQSREIADLGLSFVISAGWMPGISELLPVYAYDQAKAKMDTIESLTVYFGDSGDWSDNALRDVVWYLHRSGIPRPTYFNKGERARAKMLQVSPRVDLGSRVGFCRFNLFCTPELNEIGSRFNDCDFRAYAYMPFRTAIAGVLVALLPLPERLGVRLLRNAFCRSPLPVGGFVVVRILGRFQLQRLGMTVQIFYEKHRDYRINGLVPATVARMISEGKGVQAGVHFLADAVDPNAFVAGLRKSGVEQAENLQRWD